MPVHRPVRAWRATLSCVLVGAFVPAAASADVLEARPGQAAGVLQQAVPGDTVLLREGVHRGTVAVPTFTEDVTVRPYPDESPVLRALVLRGGAHLRLEDLRIEGLIVKQTDDLTVTGSDFSVSGAFFEYTDRLTLAGNRIHDAWDGVVVNDVTQFAFERNECWAVPVDARRAYGDCLQLGRAADWRVTDNLFRDQPVRSHVDAFEVLKQNTDGLLARNRFLRSGGVVYTPGAVNRTATKVRMTVVNNLFVQTRDYAFTGVRMHDGRFLHNTAPDRYVAIGGASSGNVVVGNIMREFRTDVRRQRTYVPIEDHNLITITRNGYDRGPNDLSGSPTFVDPAADDYRLAPGSPGIDAGTLEWLPPDDLFGTARTQPDLGAIAFQP